MLKRAVIQVADWIADRPMLAMLAFAAYSLFLLISL